MREVDVSTSLIAKGCQKQEKVLDWSQRIDLIAFGSACDVCFALFEGYKQGPRIISTAAAHSKTIKCLQFSSWSRDIQNFNEDIDYLISCSIESEVILWRTKKFNPSENKLTIDLCEKFTITGCLKPITCCAAINYLLNNGKIYSLIASASSSANIDLIWNTIDNEKVDERKVENVIVQEIGFILSIDLFKMNKDSLILAVGISDGTVHLLMTNIDVRVFEKSIILRGYSDWITSLRFKSVNDGALLATANQHDVIKLWHLSFTNDLANITSDSISEHQDSFHIQHANIDNGDEKGKLTVNLEAVINSGDKWIKALHWYRTGNKLLCSSFDNGLVIFECSDDTGGIWLDKSRLENAVGKKNGLFEARFSPGGRHIIANSYSGGFYGWRMEAELNEEFDDEYENWIPVPTFGGHSDSVSDISWDPSGSYLLSCSLDETTRCFAPCIAKNVCAEIARPQVHGYALNCLTSVSISCFVSGADEKKLRCFVAPELFARSISNICGYNELFSMEINLPKHGALVPALGLTNKEISAINDNSDMPFSDAKNEENSIVWNPVELTDLPTEDHLMKNTLWPEVHKLYGHAFEVYAVASNHKGTLVASSCKASQKEHACIWLWDAKELKRRKELVYHNLTVVQLEFSHNDLYLLTVSRDRRFAIFFHNPHSEDAYDWQLLISSIANFERVHSRIIWSCSWSYDDKYFITASRDTKACLWSLSNDSEIALQAQLKKRIAITSVDFCPILLRDSYIFAIGLENGQIEIIYWSNISVEFTTLRLLDQSVAHSQSVKRLRFRPCCGRWLNTRKTSSTNKDAVYELASCGEDHAVKVYQLVFRD